MACSSSGTPLRRRNFLDAGAAEQAKAACEAVREQLGVLMQAKTEEGHIASQIAALTPWRELDLPLEQTGTAIRFSAWASVPGRRTPGALRTQMEAEGLAAELYEIGADKLQKYQLLIVHRADEERTQELLRPFGFSAVRFSGLTGTAAENLRSLEAELAASARRRAMPRRPLPPVRRTGTPCGPMPTGSGRGGQGAVRRGYPDG